MANPHPTKTLRERPQDINKKGRPRESLTFRKLKKMTTDEIMTALWKVGDMTKDEVEVFKKDPKAKLLEIGLAGRLAKGDVDVILNRLLGMPKQPVEHSGSIDISDNEFDKLLQDHIDEYNKGHNIGKRTEEDITPEHDQAKSPVDAGETHPPTDGEKAI